jgi:hypothetical protein
MNPFLPTVALLKVCFLLVVAIHLRSVYRSRFRLCFLGTSSVQLSERKGGLPIPKRHQTKHLEFVLS